MKTLLNFLLVGCTFLTFNANAQQSIEERINYYTLKINKYLDKDNSLKQHYSIDTSGIKMYADAAAKNRKTPEFTLPWSQVDYFVECIKNWEHEHVFSLYTYGSIPPECIAPKPLNNKERPTPEKPLNGYKIALDPGHIAHTFEMGKLEQKYLNLYDSIFLTEGIYTYATATLLKQKLEKQGAQVFVTRPADSLCAYGITFDQYMTRTVIDSLYNREEIDDDQRKALLNPNMSLKNKFRHGFKHVELTKRASTINEFKPDLTAIIHFNVDEKNNDWTRTTDKDFNMCFVGGAFMRNDLAEPDKRFEFLRLVISPDLEESITLSSSVVKSFSKTLNIPAAKISDASYLQKGCIATPYQGVFCRNLQLTRMIHGPIVYGESLYQDNKNEALLLQQETNKLNNKRIQEVAEAYYQGIMNYLIK